MSATEFIFGKGERAYRVTGVITIDRSRLSPNKRPIDSERVRELVDAAYRAQPWIDDECPSPREYCITAEEFGSMIKVKIILRDHLRQSQLRPFAKYILSIARPLCYGELEYLKMYCEMETSQFLGFGVWG
jgi:hypothetical protein